jgi:microsomal dipeptidase-like Zn-dependent dipeptidase
MNSFPIIDLHCDLLTYLSRKEGATINDIHEIGAALPHLQAGNVVHQVMAIFAFTKPGSVEFGKGQIEEFKKLNEGDYFEIVSTKADSLNLDRQNIGMTAAIESASVLCEEDEAIGLAMSRLDEIVRACKKLFYISFTHHTENRFGGGNYSDNIGLKKDGEQLLEYMDGKSIAIDFAHASDQLMIDALNYIDQHQLKVPVMASHSNFRKHWEHVRNLPDELAQEIVIRKGLIGMNFLRNYIHETQPEHLLEHIKYGLNEIAEDALAFGADYFDTKAITDPERQPLFFEAHENASKYPMLLNDLVQDSVEENKLRKLSNQNVLDFINRNWA